MTDSISDLNRRSQAAFQILQTGKQSQARELFESIVESPNADTSHWFGLACACAECGDNDSALKAVDRSIALEPRNVRANLFKADYLNHLGESQNAGKYYQMAVRLTAGATDLPPDVQRGLERAKTFTKTDTSQYQTYVHDKLASVGYSSTPENKRFQQSLDIMFESKNIYYQQPRRYNFPYLPQIQFYERDDFEWVKNIEAATDDIRTELLNIIDKTKNFLPYIKDINYLNPNDKTMIDNEDWTALYLYEYGKLIEENAKSFPKTMQVLKKLPLPNIRGQAPMALFSKLTPGAKIPPHNGLLNTRLICHLPLIVPENCGALRVGNETRPWEEGRLLIFDDSIEHEAWNSSNEVRVVLLFEIWRPELSDDEKKYVTNLLEAAKEFNQQ